MKIAILIFLSLAGLAWNTRAARRWWKTQRKVLPPTTDVWGWLGVASSGLWYAFVAVFFVGLTVNNTLFR